MRYCALLAAVVFVSMFVVIGCDNPPSPEDQTVYDKNLDGEPNIHTLDAVVVIDTTRSSASREDAIVSEEVEEVETAPEEAIAEPVATEPPANPFAIPATPVEATPAPVPPTPAPAEPEATPETPETPAFPAAYQPQKDVLRKIASAVRASNETEFMEYVQVQKAHKPFIFGLAQSLDQFNAKMKKTYGDDAIEGSKSDLLPSAEDIDDKIEITVAGNSAIVKMQGQGKTLRMLKQNNKWVVDLFREIPLGNNTQRNKTIYKAVRRVVAQAEKKIGKPGYTAKQINDELESEMMAAVAGAAFDDKIGDVLKGMKIGR